MNKIKKDDTTCISIDDFILKVIDEPNKPIVFWDTCSLLNIVRFIYREDGKTPDFIVKIQNIANKINNDEVFSVSCEINISEWNDNIDKILLEIADSLQLTSDYHECAIGVINNLTGSTKVSESLVLDNLESKLQDIALQIIQKTLFLKINHNISHNALRRVEHKKSPANKKNEFKDCAIWETMLELSRRLEEFTFSQKRIFYTINTEDFCDKRGKTILGFNSILLSEATMFNCECATTLDDVLKFL